MDFTRSISVVSRVASGVLRSRNLLLCALVSISCAFGATYYVSPSGSDSNPGTPTQPYRTVARGVQQAGPGDTIILGDGTYGNEGHVSDGSGGYHGYAAPVQISKAGTPNAWITLKAQNPGMAILDCGTTTSSLGCDKYIILQSGAAYWSFEGLVFTRGAWGALSTDNSASNIRVRGCTFAYIGNWNDSTQIGEDGIGFNSGASNWWIEGNVFHDIGRIGGSSLDHGIYAEGTNVTVINNVFYNNTHGWAIQMANGANNWLIANNTFAFPNPTQNGHIMMWNTNTNITIRNNIFYNPQGSAITRYTSTVSNCFVDHNLIFGASSVISSTSGCTMGTNLIGANPNFVNAATAPYNFQVQAGGAGIDAGTPISSVAVDFAGVPRPQGNGYDIGAYEYRTGGTVTGTPSTGSPGGLGSIAQVASAGGWGTRLTLLNLDAAPVSASLNFYSSANGNALPLPFTFPQGSAAPMTGSSMNRSVNPNAQFVLDTTGPANQPASDGWSAVQASGNLDGFATLSNSSLGWQTIVPLESRNAASYTLPFDNTGSLVTAVAVANASSAAATIPVLIRDDSGAQIGTDALVLAPHGHTSFLLNQYYTVTGNRRGTVQFGTPQGGQISVTGLRATGAASLSTLPVFANGGTSGAFTHVAYNGGFSTTFYLTNTGTSPASFTLNFFDDYGNPMAVPLWVVETGDVATTWTLSQTIAPGAMLAVQTLAQDGMPGVSGSAQLTVAGSIAGHEILTLTGSGQEVSIPLETRNPNSFLLVFDDTNGSSTGVALANVTNSAANIAVNVRDDGGALLQTGTLYLGAQGHATFMVPGFYAASQNRRGTIEFIPSGGTISAIGFQMNTNGGLTSVPALAR